MPVEAKLIPTHPQHPTLTEYPALPGTYRFEDESYEPSDPPQPGQIGRLNFACPRGHGNCGALRIGNGFKPSNKKTWNWDGNVQKPTLTPSINCLSSNPDNPKEKYAGCGWHGYLTAGQFVGDGL